MATTTPTLGLVKPNRGEFTDNWHTPVNGNSDKIDANATAVEAELAGARGNALDIGSRLGSVVDPDGIPITAPEVKLARVSQVYGHQNADLEDWDLKDRADAGDREVYNAREDRSKLRDALADRSQYPGCNIVVSAPAGFLSFTADELKLDGTSQEILINISGYFSRVKKLIRTVISGAAGTYYAFVTPSEEVLVDGDATSAPPSSPTGQIAENGSGVYNRFIDVTQNFISADVAAGNILDLVDGAYKGQYIVKAVISATEVEIYGTFNTTTAVLNLNYTLTDMFSLVLGFEAAKTPAASKVHIGEFVFDGAQITSVLAYAVQGKYTGFTAVSAAPSFDVTIDHALGDIPDEIFIYGSQANDGSVPLEPLSVAGVASTLALNAGSETTVAPTSFYGSATSGGTTDQSVTVTPGVAPSLSGVVQMKRSVAVQITKTQIRIKNVLASHFYTDFAGVDKTSGYLYVVVKK